MNKQFRILDDSDFTFITNLTLLIGFLTTILITTVIKEKIALSLNATLLIEFTIYLLIIVSILKYYYTEKYKKI